MFTTHTPVPAGHDAFPFNLVETHLAGAWGTLGAYRDALPGARPLRQRQRSALQHDGARAADGRVRQRREPAARAGHARDVGPDLAGRRRTTSGRSAPSPTASTCRPGSSSEMAGAVRSITSARDWRERHDDPALWDEGAGDPGRGAVGRAQRAAQLPVRLHPRARAVALEGRARQRRRGWSPPARCSIRTR